MFLVDRERLRADVIELDGDEGRHAAAVRRIRVGETIELTDGSGHVARARVVEVRKVSLSSEVLERRDVPAPTPRLTVVQALPKGDRGERAVEAMTEVGVDAIVPWSAARCITQWRGERGEKALRKWRATAREAAKQSRRAWHPDLTELADTQTLLTRVTTARLALVFHESAEQPVSRVDIPPDGDVVMVIGPEGGITDDELASFRTAGAQVVRMGPSVLRTSTAGAVAAGVVLSRTPRWDPSYFSAP